MAYKWLVKLNIQVKMQVDTIKTRFKNKGFLCFIFSIHEKTLPDSFLKDVPSTCLSITNQSCFSN